MPIGNRVIGPLLEGIGIIADDQKRRAAISSRQKLQQQQLEQQQLRTNQDRRFRFLNALSRDENVTPETRQQASSTLLSFLQDPHTSIGDLDIQQQQPEEVAIPDLVRRILPSAPETASPDQAKELFGLAKSRQSDLTTRRGQDIRQQEISSRGKSGGSTGGFKFKLRGEEVQSRDVIKDLQRDRKEAVSLLKTGIQSKFGGKEGLNKQEVGEFVNATDRLIKKVRSGKLSEADIKALENHRSFLAKGAQENALSGVTKTNQELLEILKQLKGE